MYFNEHSSGRHYIHFRTANSTNRIDWRIQTNSANNTIHSWTESLATFATPITTSEYRISGTTVINSSRNLTNIGTISSGAITSSGRITSTGATLTGNLDLTYAYPRINLTDTNHNSDYSIINNDGAFGIYDNTNGAYRLSINSSGNSTFSGTISSGAITSSGTLVSTINGNNTTGGNLLLGATGNSAIKCSTGA